MKKKKKYDLRLWANLLEKTTIVGDCIVYTGAKTQQGYGMYKGEYTHRLSWYIKHGKLMRPWLYVCHKCDNPSCVRPSHLFLGTQKENIADAIRKGRFTQFCKKGESRIPKGTQNERRKLTDEQVIYIRASNLTHKKLSKKFKVCESAIYNIKHNITYKDVK